MTNPAWWTVRLERFGRTFECSVPASSEDEATRAAIEFASATNGSLGVWTPVEVVPPTAV